MGKRGLDWFELQYFIIGAFLLCPPCRARVRDSRCRVLQYVHDSFIVDCLSDRSINPSKGVVAYGIEGDQYILMLWLGFTLILLLYLRMLAIGVSHKWDACPRKGITQAPVHPHTKLSK